VNRKAIITAGAGLLLAGLAATGFVGWHQERQKVEELQMQLADMEKQKVRSAIDRSVSAQMEQVAEEMRQISDEQREEALQQTRVANEMRLQSEQERMKAVEAERNALAAEKKAVEASAIAENERQIAEHQRIQAEFSKRVADTLSYIALGRSLGSISTIQYQTGNKEIANLLSYASYLFTSRYQGDVYNPSVFQSLMQSSESMVSWSESTGAIMSLEFMPNEVNKFITVSNYGEIVFCERKGDRLDTKSLFKNSQYDFRDLYIDKSTMTVYAISRTGQLVIIPLESHAKSRDQKIKIVDIDNMEYPMKVNYINNDNLLIIGEKSLGLFDKKRQIVRNVKQTPFRIVSSTRKQNLPIVFDDQGMMHLIKGLDTFESSKVPVPGRVTAYCESKNTGFEAYGMNDGTIWLVDKEGNTQKLFGHRSRISKMKLNGRRLFSSSYDGKVNLWISNNEKIEPMTLLQTNNWITCFTFDTSKNTFWMGDIKGNLTAVNISVPTMVEKVQQKMKRNLTTEEWNYFIGQSIPYEKYISEEK
jgi:WD40 repeat protein